MTSSPDLGPAPDLSNYDTLKADAYEWFLSDHPWAVAERERRAAEYYREELDRAAHVQAWATKIDLAERGTLGRDFEGNVRRLAEIMRPMAEKAQQRAEEESAVPREDAVLEDRRRLEISRQVSDEPDYTYPEHLTGPGAAAYPPPASGFTKRSTERSTEPGTEPGH
ncbi:hypothetical protein [Kribbella sp. NPDC048928]|uniref:hypothetical protein n=1 Tax=Kribbella sp. NPDC048928 TaxID=3364111 RepID=UPI003712B11D